MSFVSAVAQVLKHEGGFVNHPADKGGATNWGITKRVYEAHVGRTVTVDEIKNMPQSVAAAIYKKNYWDAVGGDKIKSYGVAFALFDQAVNRGVGTVVKQTQKILGLPQDGAMGPKTLAALNAVGETEFLARFFAASLASYNAIVAARPEQGVFLRGWMNRLSSLEDYVEKQLGVQNGSVVIGQALLLALMVLVFAYVAFSGGKA